MNIKFEIETLGYLTAEISVNGEVVKISHSADNGDKFQELLNKIFLIDIIKGYDDRQLYFPYSFEVIWDAGFVNYKWIVKQESPTSKLCIIVNEMSPEDVNYKRQIANICVDVDDFFNDLYWSLHEMFTIFGFLGYKKNWEVGNFPVCEYITLKSKRRNKELKSKYNSEDESGWVQKILLEDEIEMLLHST